MTGGALFTFLPPTRKRVEESLIHGSLHPLFLEDACRIRREKDAWLVTDKARDFGALLKACPMPDRPTASPKRRRRASRFSSSRPRPTPRPRSATPSSRRAEVFSSLRASDARNSKRSSDVRAPGSTRTGARRSVERRTRFFAKCRNPMRAATCDNPKTHDLAAQFAKGRTESAERLPFFLFWNRRESFGAVSFCAARTMTRLKNNV